MENTSRDSETVEREGAFVGAPAALFTQPGILVVWVKVVAAVVVFAIALTEILSVFILGPQQGGEWALVLAGVVLLPILALLVCASTW